MTVTSVTVSVDDGVVTPVPLTIDPGLSETFTVLSDDTDPVGNDLSGATVTIYTDCGTQSFEF